MARKRYRKNPSGTTWLLLGGGGLLAWHLMKPKPTMRQLPNGQIIPTAPTSGGGFFDTLISRAGEILKGSTAPVAPKYTKAELAEMAQELEGYSSALGGDYGTLGGGRYGSLS